MMNGTIKENDISVSSYKTLTENGTGTSPNFASIPLAFSQCMMDIQCWIASSIYK